MRRLIKWYDDNADAVVGVLAGVSVVMITLWAMMW